MRQAGRPAAWSAAARASRSRRPPPRRSHRPGGPARARGRGSRAGPGRGRRRAGRRSPGRRRARGRPARDPLGITQTRRGALPCISALVTTSPAAVSSSWAGSSPEPGLAQLGPQEAADPGQVVTAAEADRGGGQRRLDHGGEAADDHARVGEAGAGHHPVIPEQFGMGPLDPGPHLVREGRAVVQAEHGDRERPEDLVRRGLHPQVVRDLRGGAAGQRLLGDRRGPAGSHSRDGGASRAWRGSPGRGGGRRRPRRRSRPPGGHRRVRRGSRPAGRPGRRPGSARRGPGPRG